MDSTGRRLPRVMIGFVVRRCAADLGRSPTPAEFAMWANHRGASGRGYALFGRRISEAEAQMILRHQARLVTAKSAAPGEEHWESEHRNLPAVPGQNVIPLAKARARLTASPSRQR